MARRSSGLFYNENTTARTKTELAKELGIKIPKDGYWGNMPSRICGAVGGAIGGEEVRKAVEDYEEKLINKNDDN